MYTGIFHDIGSLIDGKNLMNQKLYRVYKCRRNNIHSLPETTNKSYISRENPCPFSLFIREFENEMVAWNFKKIEVDSQNNFIYSNVHSCNSHPLFPISKGADILIKTKLLSEISPKVILSNVQESFSSNIGSRTANVNEIHTDIFISARDIKYRIKKLGLDSKLHENDLESVYLHMQNMENEGYIIELKKKGISGTGAFANFGIDDFGLIFTSKQMINLANLYGEVVFVDATNNITYYNNLKLIVAMVVSNGSNARGYPICFYLSLGESEEKWDPLWLFLFKNSNLSTKIKILLSDLAPSAYNSLKSIVNFEVYWVWCLFHVKQAWKRNINSLFVKNNSETSNEEFNKFKKVIYNSILNLLPAKRRDGTRLQYSTQEFAKKVNEIKQILVLNKQSNLLKYLNDYYFSVNKIIHWSPVTRSILINSLTTIAAEDAQKKLYTNMFIESFFNILKTQNLERKRMLRIDSLLHAIRKLECEYYVKLCYNNSLTNNNNSSTTNNNNNIFIFQVDEMSQMTPSTIDNAERAHEELEYEGEKFTENADSDVPANPNIQTQNIAHMNSASNTELKETDNLINNFIQSSNDFINCFNSVKEQLKNDTVSKHGIKNALLHLQQTNATLNAIKMQISNNENLRINSDPANQILETDKSAKRNIPTYNELLNPEQHLQKKLKTKKHFHSTIEKEGLINNQFAYLLNLSAQTSQVTVTNTNYSITTTNPAANQQ